MTKYIKNLRIVYFMTLISPLALIGIFSLTIDKGTIMMNDSIDEIFRYMIPIFGLIFIPIGTLSFKRRLKVIVQNENLDTKLQLYRGVVVQRIAFIEGVAMFSVVAFLITLNNLYIAYTVIALGFYLPIYPTIDKVKNDLNLETDSVDLNTSEQTNKNFWGKNPWLIIPLIIVLILLNYNSFKDFLSNKVILPEIQVDQGTLTDSIYHNDYLDWTFVIPQDYEIISSAEIESANEKGNKLIDNDTKNNEEPIRLLNISNGLIDFMSNLNPRVLFPNLTSEERYFEIIGDKLQNASNDKIRFEKQNQGVMQIDSLEFKYVEYFMIGENGKAGIMYISRFNKDYIFDLSITYRDTQKAIEFLDRLKKSDLNWE
ncbi:hypothetical protein [Marinifilum caeruleilacunae]|uniref:Uncharacterized protein n=1 Tax=Marinifilum caeruleilacunae TaxID=2499076 RepID=A0ABX1X2E3_9BACT|nr:hypothetical protein [Marinifilum caeruleilacunae]NOU62296.1 hypothetical protein [Marinifilum caeruleilacunae]